MTYKVKNRSQELGLGREWGHGLRWGSTWWRESPGFPDGSDVGAQSGDSCHLELVCSPPPPLQAEHRQPGSEHAAREAGAQRVEMEGAVQGEGRVGGGVGLGGPGPEALTQSRWQYW